MVDGMPQQVKDLRFVTDFGTSMCHSDDDLSYESDRVIELYESDASTAAKVSETPDTPDDSSGGDSTTH